MDRLKTACCLLLVIVGILSTFLSATRIDGVCTAVPNTSGKPRPRLDTVFKVNVECVMHEQNRTIYVREAYDYGRNMGKIIQIDQMSKGGVLFDYNVNEAVMYDMTAGICVVQNLNTSDNRWMFGYKNKNGEPHVFGASGALHFGDSPEEYIGPSHVRGILADRWDSCQYSDVLNATMKVSWYFSVKPDWDMQLGRESLPIRATAVGKQYKYGFVVPFDHVYNLFGYEDEIRPEDFEIPAGIVCPGRIQTKPFPTIPKKFSFIGEMISYDANFFTPLGESYDQTGKINLFVYKDQSQKADLVGADRIWQVNDFNEGVTYIVDRSKETCKITPIGQGSGYAFVHYLENGKVSMKTPAEFFAEYSKQQYTYGGTRTVRGIGCDVWVAQTNQIQGYTDQNVTVEWYFAQTGYADKWNTFSSGKMAIPVQFRMWKGFGGMKKPIYEFNVYFYDTTRPIYVDIGPCFYGSERRRFTFDIDGSQTNDVLNNMWSFQYALKSAVSLYTGISQLRIADIEVYSDVNVLHVSFDLLDKPTLAGDVYNITQQNSLSSAVQLYNDAMNSGMLKLSVVIGSNVKTITPVPGSQAEVTAQSSGFGSGALAGLGVAMLIVGSAGGAGGSYFFMK